MDNVPLEQPICILQIERLRLHETATVNQQGQCASPGAHEGTARLIYSPHEADKLEAGDVLIAPYTDPSWTPLFNRAGAIVVATGSFLSHAGTVARELQVPCIVDVADCMSRFQSGQRLRIDASKALIEVIE